MHEMALVHNIVDIVVEQAACNEILEVHAVHLTIGNGRDIVKDYFSKLFKFLARDTVAEKAELIIEWVPITVKCETCGSLFPIKSRMKDIPTCPSCGSQNNFSLNSGIEFSVDYIEV